MTPTETVAPTAVNTIVYTIAEYTGDALPGEDAALHAEQNWGRVTLPSLIGSREIENIVPSAAVPDLVAEVKNHFKSE